MNTAFRVSGGDAGALVRAVDHYRAVRSRPRTLTERLLLPYERFAKYRRAAGRPYPRRRDGLAPKNKR